MTHRSSSNPADQDTPNAQPSETIGAGSARPCSILHLEDNEIDTDLIRATLALEGIDCRITQVSERSEFIAALARKDIDLILADHSLPSFDGTQALELARQSCPEIPFIFLSGTMDDSSASRSLRQGANDCISKGDLRRLGPSVRRAIEIIRERSERLRAEVERDHFFSLSLDLLCVLDFDHRLQRVNAAWEPALGLRSEPLVSASLLDFLHADDRANAEQKLRALALGGEPVLFEARALRSDGSHLWLQWNAACFPAQQLIHASARDITGLKLAQEELRQREEHFRNLTENSSDIITVLDGNGIIRYESPSIERILGYQPSELTGKSAFDFLHPDDRPKIVGIIRRMVREVGRVESAEFRFRHKDGSWRVLEALGRTSRDRVDAVCVVVNSRDITERHEAAEALRHSEARTRAVVESSLDCVITMDRNGRIVEFNPASEKTFGYTRTEVLGRSMADLIVPPRLREKYRSGFAHYLETQESTILGRRIETQAMRRDGSEFPIELAISRVAFEGAPHFTACMRDIADRKQAEAEIQKLAAFPRLNPSAVFEFTSEGTLGYFNDAALEMARSLGENHPLRILPPDTTAIVRNCLALGQSKLRHETQFGSRTLSWAFYPISSSGVVHCYANDITEQKRSEEQIREQAALLDKAQDAIVVRDLEHRIVYWNKGAERIFGWSATEAVGRNSIDFISKKDGARFLDALKTVLATSEWSGELHQATRAGGEVIVESRWTLVRDSAGQPKAILALSTDITEKKRLEAQFLRAQRLESIGTLASGIAHDLNNILAPIMMSVNLLQETVTNEMSAKLLETLRCSAQRGADMVKQILSFTRGQDGTPTVINLKHLINEVVKIARETFPRKIEIKTNLRKDLWPILADTTQIHQVLMNLSVNARDAMPEGGTLTIEAQNLQLEAGSPELPAHGKPGPYVALSVADTGTGIAPEIMQKIWEPFFTMKPQGQGTGLGLSTVANIVRAHDGFIHTQSQLGKGTCFRICFPPAEMPAKAAGQEPAPPPPLGNGEKILIIDDERAFQEITKAIFNKHGYRVLTASDGTEAVALFAQHKDDIDLVMTDMIMPYLDGPATINALRRLNPRVPIIAASGMSESEKMTEQFPHATFLQKPFTTEKLLATVDHALHSDHVVRN
jgi:PAS domain S-box-containing protein